MRETFETADLALAEEVLSRAYTRMRIGGRGHRGSVRLAQAAVTPAVRIDDVSFGMRLEFDGAPLGALVVGQVTSGAVSYRSGGSQRSMRAGQVYIAAQPDDPFTATVENAALELAVIDPALVGRLTGAEPGQAQHAVRFTGYRPVSERAARHWANTFAYVRDEVLGRPGAAGQRLAASTAAQLLAGTALATFPHDALTDPTIEDRRDSHSATLQRAVTFIDDHAHTDITVADVAAAARVTTRAVQLAFRQHRNETPMDYLRRVRLEHARRELTAADPGRDTVSAVAHRWGFASPSRFALYYRSVYGVAPSHTLRHG